MGRRVHSHREELLTGGESRMRVLVTGGAGFIGSHTVDRLLDRGHYVRILDGLLAPVHVEEQLPRHISDRAEVVQGDIRDRATWELALRDIDAVLHLAAYQDYLPDFSTFFHTNTVGTALLYEVIVDRRLSVEKVILASSQAVYGEGKYRCPNGWDRDVSDGASRPRNAHAPAVYYPPPRADGNLQRGEWDVHCPQCGTGLEPVWTDEET